MNKAWVLLAVQLLAVCMPSPGTAQIRCNQVLGAGRASFERLLARYANDHEVVRLAQLFHQQADSQLGETFQSDRFEVTMLREKNGSEVRYFIGGLHLVEDKRRLHYNEVPTSINFALGKVIAAIQLAMKLDVAADSSVTDFKIEAGHVFNMRLIHVLKEMAFKKLPHFRIGTSRMPNPDPEMGYTWELKVYPDTK